LFCESTCPTRRKISLKFVRNFFQQPCGHTDRQNKIIKKHSVFPLAEIKWTMPTAYIKRLSLLSSSCFSSIPACTLSIRAENSRLTERRKDRGQPRSQSYEWVASSLTCRCTGGYPVRIQSGGSNVYRSTIRPVQRNASQPEKPILCRYYPAVAAYRGQSRVTKDRRVQQQ